MNYVNEMNWVLYGIYIQEHWNCSKWGVCSPYRGLRRLYLFFSLTIIIVQVRSYFLVMGWIWNYSSEHHSCEKESQLFNLWMDGISSPRRNRRIWRMSLEILSLDSCILLKFPMMRLLTNRDLTNSLNRPLLMRLIEELRNWSESSNDWCTNGLTYLSTLFGAQWTSSQASDGSVQTTN